MKIYKDLDLIKIRDACELDFAAPYEINTYSRGYHDVPLSMWRNPTKAKQCHFEDADSFVFFKNDMRSPISGEHPIYDENAEIANFTCIEHRFVNEMQKRRFCKALSEQLGVGYVVKMPKSDVFCVVIHTDTGFEQRCKADDKKYEFF